MATAPRTLILIIALCPAVFAQSRNDWQSLAQLNPGDKIRLTLKTGSADAVFTSWTPEQVTAGRVTASKETVVRIERYRGGGRGKHVAIGAAIGFGAGFAVGAATDPTCTPTEWCLFRVSRGAAGSVVGGLGAIAGALIGVLLPAHSKELIYSTK